MLDFIKKNQVSVWVLGKLEIVKGTQLYKWCSNNTHHYLVRNFVWFFIFLFVLLISEKFLLILIIVFFVREFITFVKLMFFPNLVKDDIPESNIIADAYKDFGLSMLVIGGLFLFLGAYKIVFFYVLYEFFQLVNLELFKRRG